ncbi:prepilin peptidase [Streptomyces sp. NPDC048696]|uniref:prepilin peptidase n=1 Tax=Streptomyces sp. NPDC048696 TaxID=3365585 RepID=UPI00371D6CEA
MGELTGVRLLLVLLAAGYGLALGRLLPRAAYRLAVEPDEPWRAECPAGHPFTGWLGGPPCRTTSTATATATVTATTSAALAATTGPHPELAVWLLLIPPAVLLAAVDTRVKRLPDVLTVPLAAGAAALLGAAALVPDHAGSWRHALLGGLALGGAYFTLFLVNPGGLGFGDVKLAVGLGTVLGWYGWVTLFTGAFAGFLLGGGYGLALVVVRRAGRKDAIPFGPFMLGGAFLGLLIGSLAAQGA